MASSSLLLACVVVAAMPLKGPFSVRVTTEGGEKIIAEDAIPDGWKADNVYKSNVQAK
ncbi:hypothetical protein OsI_09655 [Oryza sativa Indica Group]|uniref:Expansin-like CBD domain-containing protein n=1 Tax=Oryza sativa subsp. indica TaxID=39946 RepID=A2XBJ6_ORYSI|nr:hypothetical protein OsI_09655 [Oryza sativa Indica Group]